MKLFTVNNSYLLLMKYLLLINLFTVNNYYLLLMENLTVIKIIYC